MKLIELLIILIIAYFLFFRKERYSYIDLPPICSKTDPGLKCKNRAERNIDLTDRSAKDCMTGKDAEVSCKQDNGIYTGGKSKLTADVSNNIINQFKSRVQPEMKQSQIQKEDLSCDTINPKYVCRIRGKEVEITPQNAKDCGEEVKCKNKAGTGTVLTKIEGGKIIDQFKSRVQPQIRQPQIQKQDLSCDTINPIYACMINGKPNRVTPQNAKDCGEEVRCRNKAGTATVLTKIERDKIIGQFKAQYKPDIIQQPVFNEELSKRANRCKMPLETKKDNNGILLCMNDLPKDSFFITIPKKSSTSPSNYIRLSEL
jgi:hypothetical protein